MIKYYLLMMLNVFLAVLAQLLLKKATTKKYSSFIRELLSVYVISAYVIFFMTIVFSVWLLKFIPLSYATMIEATSYIYIFLFGTFLYKEKISFIKVVGVILIIIGIGVASF